MSSGDFEREDFGLEFWLSRSTAVREVSASLYHHWLTAYRNRAICDWANCAVVYGLIGLKRAAYGYEKVRVCIP
jgi:hypothetical protein